MTRPSPYAVRATDSLPGAFVARMAELLGDELSAFLTALDAPDAGLRVNTLRLSPEEFGRLSPFELEPLVFPPEGFVVAADERPGRHPYHGAGLYYLQDPGAMVVGALVDPRPGERVLDLCAAPGGKATHLAARMANEGLLVANDVGRTRAAELAGNLERLGVTNAIVTSESVERFASHFGAFFDRVLVDAPCSGESMFSRSRTALDAWSVEVVRGCALRQTNILAAAAELVRPGGTLVYSTCTFSPEENEEVVQRFLDERPDFRTAVLEPVAGADQVRPSDARAGPAALRLWPHKVPGAGHFVAALCRTGDARTDPEWFDDGERSDRVGPTSLVDPTANRTAPISNRARTRPVRAGPRSDRTEDEVDRGAFAAARQFFAEVYPGRTLDQSRLVQRGVTLFETPADFDFARQAAAGAASAIESLKVVRPGLELGDARPGRFEPAHALALAIPPSEASDRVELGQDEEALRRYLEGHPLSSAGAQGWVPVTIHGFALGWGKRVGGVVKNHLPKGLRRPGGF